MTDTKLLEITRPDDMHLHVRDGEALKNVINDTAKQFARAIIMPNLKTPVTHVEQAAAYRKEILQALKVDGFQPLMTLYLTDITSAQTIHNAVATGFIHAVKLYPAGATTNSDAGVTDIAHTYSALEAMQETGLPLLVHGEVTDPAIDVFDREQVFIDRVLAPLMDRFPGLKIVMEHITTANAAEFVSQGHENLAATITAHHLLINRNAMFTGGIRPHHYCLPVLKREEHRQALVTAATSGSKKFFLGTDSAPHAQSAKESACGCAGMYTAYSAIELYTEVFDNANALDKLENFASVNGARFYDLPVNTSRIQLQKIEWTVPESLPYVDDKIIPFRAGEKCQWKMLD